MSALGHLGQLRVELIQLPSKIQSLLLRLLLGLFAGFTKLVQFRVQLGLSLDELLPLGGESGSLLLDPLGSTRDRGLLGGQARPLVLKLLRLGGEPIALRAKLNLFLLELFDSLTKLHSGRFHRGMILLKLCLSGMQTFPLALQFASLGGKFISFGLKVVGLFSEAVLLRLDPRKVFGQRFAIVLDLFVKGLDLPTFGLQFGLLLKVELGQTVDLLTAVSAFDGFTEALNLGASLEQLLVGLRDFPTLGLKLGFTSIDFELLRIELRLSRGERRQGLLQLAPLGVKAHLLLGQPSLPISGATIQGANRLLPGCSLRFESLPVGGQQSPFMLDLFLKRLDAGMPLRTV